MRVLAKAGVTHAGHGERPGLRLAVSHVNVQGVTDVRLDYIAFDQ